MIIKELVIVVEGGDNVDNFPNVLKIRDKKSSPPVYSLYIFRGSCYKKEKAVKKCASIVFFSLKQIFTPKS